MSVEKNKGKKLDTKAGKSKRPYRKLRLKVIKIDPSIIHSSDSCGACGGCGY